MSKTTDLTASTTELAQEIKNLKLAIAGIEELDKEAGLDRSVYIKNINEIIAKIENEIIRRHTPPVSNAGT